MTDEEVIIALAEREKWKVGSLYPSGRVVLKKQIDADESMMRLPWEFRYLYSRDALHPILEGLTVEEWDRLDFDTKYDAREQRGWGFTHWILTMPARDLDLALAEVIAKGKE